jgi:hypothetical protein
MAQLPARNRPGHAGFEARAAGESLARELPKLDALEEALARTGDVCRAVISFRLR